MTVSVTVARLYVYVLSSSVPLKKNVRSSTVELPAIPDDAQKSTNDVTSRVAVVPIEPNVAVANNVEAVPHGHDPGSDRVATPLCQPSSFAQYTYTARFPDGPSVTLIDRFADSTFFDTIDARLNDVTDRHFFVGFDVIFGLPTRMNPGSLVDGTAACPGYCNHSNDVPDCGLNDGSITTGNRSAANPLNQRASTDTVNTLPPTESGVNLLDASSSTNTPRRSLVSNPPTATDRPPVRTRNPDCASPNTPDPADNRNWNDDTASGPDSSMNSSTDADDTRYTMSTPGNTPAYRTDTPSASTVGNTSAAPANVNPVESLPTVNRTPSAANDPKCTDHEFATL
uniref:Unannotated protein n=1 Tax=freshwater metagenome TaxID=449393 RepID=A0A6J7MHL3_9ZZZZ